MLFALMGLHRISARRPTMGRAAVPLPSPGNTKQHVPATMFLRFASNEPQLDERREIVACEEEEEER